MDIKFFCSCGKSFRVPDRFSGRMVECPACKKKITIPQSEPTLRTIPLVELESDGCDGLQITVARSDHPAIIPRRRASPNPFVTGFLTILTIGLAYLAYPNALGTLQDVLARIIELPKVMVPSLVSEPAKEHRPEPPTVETGDDELKATKKELSEQQLKPIERVQARPPTTSLAQKRS